MEVVGYILFGIIAVIICLFCYVQITGFVRDVKSKYKKKKELSTRVENNNSSEPSTRLNEDDM